MTGEGAIEEFTSEGEADFGRADFVGEGSELTVFFGDGDDSWSPCPLPEQPTNASSINGVQAAVRMCTGYSFGGVLESYPQLRTVQTDAR